MNGGGAPDDDEGSVDRRLMLSMFYLPLPASSQGGRAANLDFSLVVENIGGNHQGIVRQGKIVTNEMFFVRHSNVCVKLLFWTSSAQSHALLTKSECGMTYSLAFTCIWNDPLMKVIITITFVAINYGKLS